MFYLGDFVVAIFAFTYLNYFYRLIFKKNRKAIIETNEELDRLRAIKNKTLDEQKQFLTIRYPPSNGFKLTWGFIFDLVFNLIAFFILYNLIVMFFAKIGYHLHIWQMLLLLILGPMVIHLLLKPFKLDQPSFLNTFFK